MSDQPHPHEGGTYIRQKDGSLHRVQTQAPAAPAKPDAGKTPASKKTKE